MTIAICDDSAIDCLLSKFLISEYFKKHRKTCDIVTYETGAKLISDFEDGAVFDIVFMDIYVGEELGIDIAGRLRNEGYDNLLIFSTITPEYANSELQRQGKRVYSEALQHRKNRKRS